MEIRRQLNEQLRKLELVQCHRNAYAPIDLKDGYQNQHISRDTCKIAIEHRRPFYIEQAAIFVPVTFTEQQTMTIEILLVEYHRHNDAEW